MLTQILFVTAILLITVISSACNYSNSHSNNAEAKPLTQVSIALGDKETLKHLYSWPNKVGSSESLADTIAHYSKQSAVRDGFSDAKVEVNEEQGQYRLTISSASANITHYKTRLTNFLNIGQLAVNAREAIKAQGQWNNDEWRLFLPLGLALSQQKSVQLLHFPPDYSLPDQDYLNSKTSQRWEQLLKINGVAANQVSRFEAIVDIAPIAAPASAGKTLSATYPYFADYANHMLSLLLKQSDDSKAGYPVVAYGYPVRQWLQNQYGQELEVLGLISIQPDGTTLVPVLGANHPSYIWYAKDQGFAAAYNVMQQDLIAARWQMRMGNNPQLNPTAVKQQASIYWQSKPKQVCLHTEVQAFNMSNAEAEKSCADSNRWSNLSKALQPSALETMEKSIPAGAIDR